MALSGFRNHVNTTVKLKPGLTVFQGANGQGKSNLLEAAYLLAIAKSPRASADRELVNWDLGQSGGHVQVLGVGREGDRTIQAQVDMDVAEAGDSIEAPAGAALRKSLRVNGIVRTAAEFVGNINVVFFEADDLEIVSGPPGVRRRFLDILISQSDPTYLKTLQRYSRVVMQRNQLLRRVRTGRATDEELVFWDERLAHEGASIIERRRRAVAGLIDHAVPAHAELTGGDDLHLTYMPRLSADSSQADSDAGLTGSGLTTRIMRSLITARSRELAQGVTIVGPHRDDVEISLGGHAAGSYASRGQARSIAMSLKMAEAAFVMNATGRTPVLALDDILSELDPGRRRLVLTGVQKYEQVLLTVTESDFVDPGFLDGAARYRVHRGEVTAIAT
ncbi:MAG: DNA replication and repair protein RecF [Dehalococcoidia bacterium]